MFNALHKLACATVNGLIVSLGALPFQTRLFVEQRRSEPQDQILYNLAQGF